MSDELTSEALERSPAWLSWTGMIAGPLLAAMTIWLLPADVAAPARIVAGVGVLMAVCWLTEALPVEATSLLPLAIFPVLGVAKFETVASPYASEQVFLFMGGFFLGRSMERWGLHERLALSVMSFTGSSPTRLVAGMMLATGVVSMWVSNTATTMFMLPIGLSVAGVVASHAATAQEQKLARNFSTCVVLGIAYAASITGVSTLIGTPPNGVFSGFVEKNFGRPPSFVSWLWVGLPMAVIVLPAAWFLLVRVLFHLPTGERADARELIRSRLAGLGPMKRGEWATLIAFSCAAVLWIARPWVNSWLNGESLAPVRELIHIKSFTMTDAGIALAAALSLFVVPAGEGKRTFVLDWPTAVKIPWGVLLFFGGGLSLAAMMSHTGVDLLLGRALSGLRGVPLWVLLPLVVASVTFLSELASNVALVAAVLPVMYAAEKELGLPPGVLLVATTVAASNGFMLPVATPPNALAYATGKVSTRQMARAGLLLDLTAIVVGSVVCVLLATRAMSSVVE
ncbi:MAG: DASS family sodium-coupled anion symporter [Phycisphaerales bacterium]|nr:DASS family sodium-coupled anion symporter [Phycisphaerales bacterium]